MALSSQNMEDAGGSGQASPCRDLGQVSDYLPEVRILRRKRLASL